MSFSNVYDSAGRLSTVTGPQVSGSSDLPLNLFTAVAYNAAGTIKDAEIGTGISLHRDYNPRLLPTDEIDAVKTTPGAASVQITGAEQLIAYSTGSITFGGSEGSTVLNGQTEYDGGTFLVFINGGQPYQISYGQNDTAQTLASKLAADISCTYASVQAVAVGATVFLTSCSAGANTNYPLTVELAGNSSYFPKASFQIMASGATMTQARPVTDSPNEPMSMIEFSGTEQNNDTGTFTIAFYNASTGAFAGVVGVSWNYQSSPQSLAAALLTSLPACSAGGLISASQNNSVVTLTSCTPGTSYVENIQLDYGGSGTASFSAEADAFLVTDAGTYDSGTVTLAINGTNVASTPYGSNSTPASIVSGLISSNGSSSPVTLTPSAGNASFLTITAKGGNTDEGYTYALSFAYNSTAFTQPSFSASSTSGTLVGGENAPLYSWAINSYAPDGNVLSMTDSVMGTWSYAYDDLNRLVTGSASAGSMSGLKLGWDYDRYGNRWDQNASGNGSAVQTHFTFSGNNNRIDQYSSNYDADGNLKGDGVHTYTYDAENRITTLNGQPMYIYDAEGMRVAKLGSGGAVSAVYILGAGGQQLTELNASGQWVHSNVYGADGLLTTYTPSTNSYHYNLTDWLGTKRMQTYASGNEEETCISYPFGDGLSCSGGADATEKHYTGKERDTESGLDYFGARYYGSTMGRWMTPEYSMNGTIMELPQSWNRYQYVYDRATFATDPDGRCPPCVGAIIGGIVEGGLNFGEQLAKHGSLSQVRWKDVGSAAFGGAVAGAIAGATGGASLLASSVVGDLAAGATSSVIGGIAERGMSSVLNAGNGSSDILSLGKISRDAVSGLVGAGAAHLAGSFVHVPDDPVLSGTDISPSASRNAALFNRISSQTTLQMFVGALPGSAASDATIWGIDNYNSDVASFGPQWFDPVPPSIFEGGNVSTDDGLGNVTLGWQ
jgi:RHS repeat-associated protein